MNGTLLGIVALALLLVCLWIWMNVMLTRPKKQAPGAADTDIVSKGDTDESTSPRADATAIATAASAVAGAPAAQAAMNDALDRAQDDGARDLEVVAQGSGRHGRKVFDQTQEHPFRINVFAAPLFESQSWVECFYKLNEEPSVLGWIAFQENSVGASDRDYDDDFVDVLRAYKRSVEKLRHQVGLSTVLETSVIGEEGKVWFLTPVEDTWLALFVDKEADIEQLSTCLLGPVRSIEPE